MPPMEASCAGGSAHPPPLGSYFGCPSAVSTSGDAPSADFLGGYGDHHPPARGGTRQRSHRGGRRRRGIRAGARVRRGRGAAHRAAGVSGHFDVFFSNVSLWNDCARDHCMGVKADAMLLAETHLKLDKLKDLLTPAGCHGWNATAGPAQQSANSDLGSNVGVATMIHHRWNSTAWPDVADDKGRVGPYCDLVGRSVNLDGVDVQLMAAYLNCHDGVEGQNTIILQRVEYRTGLGRDLFVLAADFNLPPPTSSRGGQAAGWPATRR